MKERLTGKPFLTITDEAIITEWIKQTVIRFTDVQSFNVAKMGRVFFSKVTSFFSKVTSFFSKVAPLFDSLRGVALRL